MMRFDAWSTNCWHCSAKIGTIMQVLGTAVQLMIINDFYLQIILCHSMANQMKCGAPVENRFVIC